MSFRSALVPVLAASLAAAGCASAPHVALRAPATGAPAGERLAAYDSLHPAGQVDTLMVRQSTGQVVSQAPDFLLLGNGERVHHVEDLEPVVPADSPTARSGRRIRELEAESRPWLIGGSAVAGVSLAASLYFLAAAPSPGDSDFDSDTFDRDLGYSTIGLVAAVAAFGLVALTGIHYGKLENEERTVAFMTYDTDLRRELDVCVDGTRIVACPLGGTTPPATATPAAPAAAPAAPIGTPSAPSADAASAPR